MLFFKNILNFKSASGRNKRKAPRYVVGPDFPLKGTISLGGPGAGDGFAAAAGCDWAGRLANLSTRGASLMLPPAALTTRGEKTTLTLSIEQHALQVPCAVTYFRVLANHAVCGLTLEFADEPTEKSYLQLHEAVRIGATFTPVKLSARQREAGGLSLEQFESEAPARLAVWREAPDGRIDSFELVIGDHCLRGEARGPTLEVYAREAPRDAGKAARSEPAYNLSPGITTEVRQLFRWVSPNLSKAVPADVRSFLRQLIGETRTPAERKLASAPPVSRPPVASASPVNPNFGKPGQKAPDGIETRARLLFKSRSEAPG